MKNKNIELNKINLYFFNNIQISVLFKIMLLLLNISSDKGKLIHQIYYYSEIRLKVLGKGDINILSDNFIFEPSEVIINDESNNCKKICNFQEEENNVILYFSDVILLIIVKICFIFQNL